MSAAPMAQTPAVPPRPSRSSDRGPPGGAPSGTMPKVPPRPVNKHLDRSVSPSRDRFAPSPLMQGIPRKPSDDSTGRQYSQRDRSEDPIERVRSVDMPSVGEEGMEYSAVTSETAPEGRRPSSPEQTRMVAESLKLHAPKPSLPASSAKQRVMAVTRTDSDRAASFGIGRPSTSEDRAVSRSSNHRKRPESIHSAQSEHTEDEQGIPEIGQRVPMNKHLGDVQAPSPGPGAEPSKKNHSRSLSARALPPGSYGLHGHGVTPQDKLEKAYYEKHPEALQRERHTPHHDRQNDFAMSSSDLNKLVRDTATRQAATVPAELRGTPTDDIAFEATQKYTSRISSSRRTSVAVQEDDIPESPQLEADDKETVHVDEGNSPEFYSHGDVKEDELEDYSAPILASDEVIKDPNPRAHRPAIRPNMQRRGSSFDGEETPSRPTSRPASRTRTQRQPSPHKEIRHTPLEDVEEYDPLFPEDGKDGKDGNGKDDKAIVQESAEELCERHHFPSKDIWEDAPNSAHATAEVSTPDVPEPERRRSSAYYADRPITPAQAFALYQEQLAEKEAGGRTNGFLPLQDSKPPTWAASQPHLQTEMSASGCSKRFPSRDIWEDTPESHIQETEISGPGPSRSRGEPQPKPEIPARPNKKATSSPEGPAVSESPTGTNTGEDSAKPRPSISDKPKPFVPPRPAKSSSGDSADGLPSKPKPPVPSRPVGGKIAALQGGFMSDLNKRLQLGPQAVKKDDPLEDETGEEKQKEKAVLTDARKSRARGPQRRAPAKSSGGEALSSPSKLSSVLSFSLPQAVWSIDPEDGNFALRHQEDISAAVATANSNSSKPLGTLQDGSIGVSSLATAPLSSKPAVAPSELETTAKPNQGSKPEPKTRETQELTLAANTAGESILETKVETDGIGVKPLEVHEDVKDIEPSSE